MEAVPLSLDVEVARLLAARQPFPHRAALERRRRAQRPPRRLRRVGSFQNGGETLSIEFVEEADRKHFRVLDLDPRLEGAAPTDFFELLGIGLGATREDIRTAYRSIQREVHPDVIGPLANEMAVLLNQAYAALTNDATREAYAKQVREYRSASGGSFSGRPVSAWHGAAGETRAVFVDETECIGCTHCSACAPNTFFMEDHHGRARVFQQWGDSEEEIREAVDLCPVDCIYYVQRSQLALLEWILKSCDRECIALMARRRSGNMGSAPSSGNPFVRAAVYIKHREEPRTQGKRPATSRQDDELAGAIANAFFALPHGIRCRIWPEWTEAP